MLFENLSEIRQPGLDDRFLRKWDFYLCYCETGFEEREIGAVQAVFENPEVRRPALLEKLG